MSGFNLNDLLNSASKETGKAERVEPPRRGNSEITKISVYDLVPSEDNFYSMKEIDELKTSIQLAGKVLQNLVVVPLPDGKYKVIAGHRRRLASIALVEAGNPEYEFVPCDVEPSEERSRGTGITRRVHVDCDEFQREKTAWDRIEEVRYLRDILKRQKQSRASSLCFKDRRNGVAGMTFSLTEPATFLAKTLQHKPDADCTVLTRSFGICRRTSRKS